MSEMLGWRRSSFCASGACAEIKIDGDIVFLRNSQRPEFMIELTRAEWETLKKAVIAGEF
jgi:hypothetical protein